MLEFAPSLAQSFSRTVRMMTSIFLGTAIFGTLSLYFLSTQMFGVSRHTQNLTVSTSECGGVRVSCDTMADQLLARAILDQQRAGRTCSAQPSLTDIVLFQYSADQRVSALTFDDALEASGQKLGWVQRYCH